MRENNILKDKTMDFAEKLIVLYKELVYVQKEYVLSKQMLRSGTSIGANVVEAIHAQSQADFYAKLKIADKEAAETAYWLELLKRGKYIDLQTYSKLSDEVGQIAKIIVASCKTLKTNMDELKRKS